MRAQRKSVLLAALAAVFSLAIASCGGQGHSAGDGNAIVIGGLFDLTGSNATVGIAVRNATQMAFDKVNASGGINGRQLELSIQDEASDSAKGVTAFNYLHNQVDTDLIFGATFTGAAVAVADVANKQQVLLYSSSATSPVLTNPTKRYVFAANQTAAISAKGIAGLIRSMGATRIGFVEETDAYGAQGRDTLQAALQAEGGGISVVQDVKIAPDATDGTSQITALKGAGVDVVVQSVIQNPAVALIKAAQQQGLNTPIVSFGGGTGTAIDKLLTSDAPIEYYAPTPLACPLDGQCASTLGAEYQKQFGQPASEWALHGYAAAQQFVEALKATKGELTPDAVAATLESMPPYRTDVIPVPLKFSATNHLGVDTTFFIGHKGGALSFLGTDLKDNKL